MQDKTAIQKSGSFLTQGELTPLVGKLKRRSMETFFRPIVKTGVSDLNYVHQTTVSEIEYLFLVPEQLVGRKKREPVCRHYRTFDLWPKANAISPSPINYRSA
jgi:hypothetical protein